MKLWSTIFIVTFLIVYGTVSLSLWGGWVLERARVLRDSHRPASRRTSLPALFVAFLVVLVGSVSPPHAGSETTRRTLRGDLGAVPTVPPREPFRPGESFSPRRLATLSQNHFNSARP